jgi:hypothetical protein
MDFIKDTTEYIFLENEVKISDVIFVPGSSNPLLPRRAAELYLEGFAKYVMPSGKHSITRGEYMPSLPGTETEGIRPVPVGDNEAVEALCALGYTQTEAARAVSQAEGENVSDVIRNALKILAKSL